MKSVSEQRERIIGLKSEMPKAKDVPDGTIYENLTDGTVNVAYHGTWYEKKNSEVGSGEVDLTEINNELNKRLKCTVVRGSNNTAKLTLPSGMTYVGLISVYSQYPELWAFTLGEYCSATKLSKNNNNSNVQINISNNDNPEDTTKRIYTFNLPQGNPFTVLLLNYHE